MLHRTIVLLGVVAFVALGACGDSGGGSDTTDTAVLDPGDVSFGDHIAADTTPASDTTAVTDTGLGDTTVAQDTVVADTTVAQDTVVADTTVAQDTVVADTTVAQDTVQPQDTVQQDTVQQDTVVAQDTVQQDTVQQDTVVAQDTVQQDTVVAQDTVQQDTSEPADTTELQDTAVEDTTAPGCPTGTTSAGTTLALDGADDLAKYASAQVVQPAAWLGADDAFGITWDADYLYLSLRSDAFTSAFLPLHVYLEAGAPLATVAPSTGKEYGGLSPILPFTATHLVAVREQSDAGDGLPYDAVYTPGLDWTVRVADLTHGEDVWVAADKTALSVRVPWTVLGCPSALRLTAHVVNGAAGNEWKDFLPTTATPWATGGGGYYEIDLTGDPAISGWALP